MTNPYPRIGRTVPILLCHRGLCSGKLQVLGILKIKPRTLTECYSILSYYIYESNNGKGIMGLKTYGYVKQERYLIQWYIN